jgi:hypothetical protein
MKRFTEPIFIKTSDIDEYVLAFPYSKFKPSIETISEPIEKPPIYIQRTIYSSNQKNNAYQ